MKTLFTHLIRLLFPSMMLIPSNFYAQATFDVVKLDTQKSIAELRRKLDNSDSADKAVFNNLDELTWSVTKLFEKIETDETLAQKRDTSFVNALVHSQHEISRLVADSSSAKEISKIIALIKKDYDIKTHSAPLGASSKVVTSVEVTVKTTRNNQEFGGYDVLYTYVWDSLTKKKKRNFTNKTNDAVKKLAPGYYLLWIEKDGVLIQSKQVEIGNLELPKEPIIFQL